MGVCMCLELSMDLCAYVYILCTCRYVQVIEKYNSRLF